MAQPRKPGVKRMMKHHVEAGVGLAELLDGGFHGHVGEQAGGRDDIVNLHGQVPRLNRATINFTSHPEILVPKSATTTITRARR